MFFLSFRSSKRVNGWVKSSSDPQHPPPTSLRKLCSIWSILTAYFHFVCPDGAALSGIDVGVGGGLIARRCLRDGSGYFILSIGVCKWKCQSGWKNKWMWWWRCRLSCQTTDQWLLSSQATMRQFFIYFFSSLPLFYPVEGFRGRTLNRGNKWIDLRC